MTGLGPRSVPSRKTCASLGSTAIVTSLLAIATGAGAGAATLTEGSTGFVAVTSAATTGGVGVAELCWLLAKIPPTIAIAASTPAIPAYTGHLLRRAPGCSDGVAGIGSGIWPFLK